MLCLTFAGFVYMAFPAKNLPVAGGNHAHGPSCLVEREYCPHCSQKITAQQGVQGDAVPLPGSGERCPGDSVKGPQLISLLSRSPS